MVFNGFLGSAQESKFNKFSLEISAGAQLPLTPEMGISQSEYVSFQQFGLSGRYMFTEKLGLKGHYSYNRFENPDAKDMGISMNRLALEGVANVGRILNVDNRKRLGFAVLVHTGIGISFANPSSSQGTDHIGNFLVGFTAQAKLSERFSLFGDVTYIRNFKQHFDYNGILINNNYDAVSGSYVSLSIGLIYSLGSEQYHADWY